MTQTWCWHSSWPAPAKINLFLHVVGRRADGYHELQTVFRFVDWSDTLTFSPRSDDQIILRTPIPGVPPEQDLTVRAARLLQAATGTRQGVEIMLDKQLPMGGGLGGGSSDAATVLLALNHLWGCALSRSDLQRLGVQLGADVPVFVFGQNSFAQGIGDELLPQSLPTAYYVIVHPGVHVPTAAIFGDPALPRATPKLHPEQWLPGMGGNDLQEVACRRFPAVAEALRMLGALAPGALMTGSGACVFAGFSCSEEAERVRSALPAEWATWVVAGLDQHPLATV